MRSDTQALPAAQAASAALPMRFKVEPDSGSPGLTALAFVLVLAGVAAWLVKRHGGTRTLRAELAGRLALRETVWVAPKLRVSRLQYEGRTMLLASSPQGLAWLDLGTAAPAGDADDERPGHA